VYEAKRAAELREKTRRAAAAATATSPEDSEQLYRDRLEFEQKIHGDAHAKTYIAMWNLAAFLFEQDIKVR
jgi:hypothetical protein